MKKQFLLLMACSLPFFAFAKDDPACKKKDKHNLSQGSVLGMEDFVFTFPDASGNNCDQGKAFEKTVVDFYKWYLQHESRIEAGLTENDSNRDLMPPFNITWETLQQYFEIIKKNYPDLISGADSSTDKMPSSGTQAGEDPAAISHTPPVESQSPGNARELTNSSLRIIAP